MAKPSAAAIHSIQLIGSAQRRGPLIGLEADQQAAEYVGEVEQWCKEAGVACASTTSTSDVPYEAIIDAAEKSGCDLIFMASHGRRGISGLLLGSETNKVLTHSKIPVLVYR